jgi:hypothetical protein
MCIHPSHVSRRKEFVMRLKSIIAAVAAAVSFLSLASAPAQAWSRKPSGWGEERTVHHYGYYPRYNHVYHIHYRTDPYAYRYEPRGYYPYYNSGYWRPAHEVRRNRYYALPPYYQAWGYPNPNYHHRAWHKRHHGGHHIGHW